MKRRVFLKSCVIGLSSLISGFLTTKPVKGDDRRYIFFPMVIREAAPFLPNDLPNLILWLSADKITGLSDGDRIASWPDNSGNGNHCVQFDESIKPIYNATGINGKPEVAFSYVDLTGEFVRSMTIPNSVSITENNCTLFYVGRPVTKQLLADYCVPVSVGGVKLGWGPTYGAAVVGNLYNGTKLIFHEPHAMGLSSSYSEVKLYYKQSAETFPAGSGNIHTGGMIGTDMGLVYNTYGTLSEVLIYNRALSSIEMAKLYTYAQQKYFGSSPTKQIIFDGDSLTTGYGCLNNCNMPGQTWGLLGRDWKIYNVAVAGQPLEDMQSNATIEIDPLYTTGLTKNVLVCWGGLLDVYYGATPAVALTRLQAYCSARRAAGWKVVVLTCLPSLFISEADRTTLNICIRNNYTSWADTLVDIGANATIGAAGANNNPTYYNNLDGTKTHMTAAGYAIVARMVATAIQRLR